MSVEGLEKAAKEGGRREELGGRSSEGETKDILWNSLVHHYAPRAASRGCIRKLGPAEAAEGREREREREAETGVDSQRPRRDTPAKGPGGTPRRGAQPQKQKQRGRERERGTEQRQIPQAPAAGREAAATAAQAAELNHLEPVRPDGFEELEPVRPDGFEDGLEDL